VYKECALSLCSSPTLLHVGKVQLMTQEFSVCTLSQHSVIIQYLVIVGLHKPTSCSPLTFNQAHIRTRGTVERMFGV